MDILVVEDDTTPLAITLTDTAGAAFILGATVTFEVDLPAGTSSTSGTVTDPLGVIAVTPSAAQVATPGVYRARAKIDGTVFPSTRDFIFGVLGHTRGH